MPEEQSEVAAMANKEPQAAAADQGKRQRPEAGVGVLGWLGFVIINFAAWGMISAASWITWVFGFGICFAYTTTIIVLALWLERRGEKYKQFVNLLWVLGASFVYILGVYISVRVIGSTNDGAGSSGNAAPDFNTGELSNLLPGDASQDLKIWASTTDWVAARNPTFYAYEGGVYFSGAQQDSADSTSVLWRTTGTSAIKISPTLVDAGSFVELQSHLFFAASSPGTGRELWRIDSGDLETAKLVGEVVPGSAGGDVRHLFVDASSSALYFKANFNCPNSDSYVWVNTIFRSNGTAAGTKDLRGDPCSSLGNTATDSSWSSGPSRSALWGVLLIATVPMMTVAGFVLWTKRMPGLFVNLFYGVMSAAIVVYLLINYDSASSLPSFLKWFITTYTSILWVAIVVLSLIKQKLPEWQEELKSWAVVVVGISFFIIVHIDLQIPFNDEAWRWIVYALVAVMQMVASAVVSRSVPMIAGAIGLFVLSWKIAFELVEFADFAGGELKMLAMLAILALQGIGIILLAIFYAGRRSEIDDKVRAVLTCNKWRAAAVDAEMA